MDIIFKLGLREYIGLQYALSFRKPATLILLAFGILSLLSIPYFNGSGHKAIMPFFALIYGILVPAYALGRPYFFARSSFLSNKLLQAEVIYRFSDKHTLLSGDNFTDSFDMSMLYKVLEIKDWFLLFVSNRNFIIIPKRAFSDSDIIQFRALLNSLPQNIKKKLK